MSKRMFSTNIVESDAFLDMPLTAQSLYFHLSMNADNDGFVNPKRIVRMTGAANDDLQILIIKRFILVFDSGIAVIKHWWINNTKRHDRHVPTTYQNELAELCLKDNKAYTKNTTQLAILTDNDLASDPEWQPTDNQRLPQYNTIQGKATQGNPMQSSPIQVNPNSPKGEGFKKNKNLDKRQYAKAVRADEEQKLREQNASARGYDKFHSSGELLKNKQQFK
jgi:hypothetical protein